MERPIGVMNLNRPMHLWWPLTNDCHASLIDLTMRLYGGDFLFGIYSALNDQVYLCTLSFWGKEEIWIQVVASWWSYPILFYNHQVINYLTHKLSYPYIRISCKTLIRTLALNRNHQKSSRKKFFGIMCPISILFIPFAKWHSKNGKIARIRISMVVIGQEEWWIRSQLVPRIRSWLTVKKNLAIKD